jgi:hypothetical protein
MNEMQIMMEMMDFRCILKMEQFKKKGHFILPLGYNVFRQTSYPTMNFAILNSQF